MFSPKPSQFLLYLKNDLFRKVLFFEKNQEGFLKIFDKKISCQSVAVYLRSLRIIAAEEKNIPGPSRELMDCK